MISFKAVLRKKKLSTGKYPIYLRISKDRNSIFFRTPYTAETREWNGKKGLFNQNVYPFKVYKVSKLKGRGFKKALSFEEVQKLINLYLTNHQRLINARNYFVFSFYTRGMIFADMMKLQRTEYTI